jgi:hypothetical protein
VRLKFFRRAAACEKKLRQQIIRLAACATPAPCLSGDGSIKSMG